MKTPDLITDAVAPLGPNARAMLEERQFREWRKQPSPRPSVVQPTKHHKRIVDVIKAAVEHRRQPCYGVKMTDAQVDELSRGIAQNLICNFKIEEAP